ncbi:MAG TPA: hypothetical protein VFE78_16100, partial [Gemmataceae bacterium]|nr:hypothetical protein [Gemmataceae bacterium]
MASTTSFKQQCPSCEAMVPIRDPGLIGRKIDCPKCKYRFVVESPDQAEAEEDEAPAKGAKKTKPGSAAVTTKPGAKAAAAKAKTKPGAKKGDEGDEDRPKKKKSGGSKVLVLGIGLAVVAIVALGVGAFLLFGGKKEPKKPSTPPQMAGMGGSGGGEGAGAPGEGDGADPTKQPAQQPGAAAQANANLGDVTNLLPNDTQAVLSVPTPRLLGSPLRRAAFGQGGFNEAHFRATLGVSLEEVRRVVMALNLTDDWVFTVVRTTKPVDKKYLTARLRLSPEPPINNLQYFLVKGRLDSLSNLLFTGGRQRNALAMHVVDPQTLVFADVAPMKKFLQANGKPKHLTTAAPAEAPAGDGEQGPAGRGRGGMGPGSMMPPGGRGRGSMGPPGGRGSMGPGAASPDGESGPPAGRGGKLGGMSLGGSTPPGGRGRGSMGPGAASPDGESGAPAAGGSGAPAGEGAAAEPATGSYLTIDTTLKSVLDKIEKTQKGEPAVLLTGVANAKVAIDTALARLGGKAFIDEAVAHIQEEMKKKKDQMPQGVNIKASDVERGIKLFQQELVVFGFTLVALSEEKLECAAAVETRSRAVAEGMEQVWNVALPLVLPELKKETGLNLTMAGAPAG